MPPFSALSSKSTWQKSSYYDPILSAELFNLSSESLIFLFAPLSAANLGADLGGGRPMALHLKV